MNPTKEEIAGWLREAAPYFNNEKQERLFEQRATMVEASTDGRCESCKWWGTVGRNDIGSRLCKKKEGVRQVEDSFQTYDAVFFGPKFGCIHWEAKP